MAENKCNPQKCNSVPVWQSHMPFIKFGNAEAGRLQQLQVKKTAQEQIHTQWKQV